MGKIIKKNYESDFILDLRLPDIVGESDFRLEFTTSYSRHSYKAGRENGYLSPNLHDMGEGKFKVVFRDHGLAPGRLKVKAYYRRYEALSPDYHLVDVSPLLTEVELWSGASDDVPSPAIVEEPTTAQSAGGIFSRLGYSSVEEKISFGEEVAYSEELKEKWINGEIDSFKNDDQLVYPPMVDVTGKDDLSMLYYKCNNMVVAPSLDTSRACKTDEMFAYDYSLRGVGEIDALSASSTNSMFYKCSALKSVSIKNSSGVEDMDWMFTDCTSLERVATLDFASLMSAKKIFGNCNKLHYIIIENLGKGPCSDYNFLGASEWGQGGDENKNSLVESVVNKSYDRTSNGMAVATVRLSAKCIELLGESNILTLENKGYRLTSSEPLL